MGMTSEPDNDGMPVTVAAAMLGISADALRKRIKRGTVKGFRAAGRVFVDPEWLEQRQRAHSRGQAGHDDAIAAAVLELQRTEMSRLLRDNADLNKRLDRMITTQEREQVLRQQMQNIVDRLSQQQALPPPGGQASDGQASDGLSSDVPPSELARIEERLADAESDFGSLKSAVAHLVSYLAARKPS